eukprot:COSAG01_NODE_31030_length_605_cov_0.796443_1_plen_45_part_01
MHVFHACMVEVSQIQNAQMRENVGFRTLLAGKGYNPVSIIYYSTN